MGFEGSPRPSNERRGNKSSEDILLLNATHREAVALAVAVLVHGVVGVAHAPAVSVTVGALRSRPPEAGVAGIDEIAIGEAVAARQGRKAKIIRPIATAVPTACRFQLLSGIVPIMIRSVIIKLPTTDRLCQIIPISTSRQPHPHRLTSRLRRRPRIQPLSPLFNGF